MAVRSDLIDRFRHQQVIDKVEVSFQESRVGDRADERRPEEGLRSAEHDPDVPVSQEAESGEHERVRTTIEAHPIFQRMLCAIQTGAKTQKDIAARCGVTDRTVRYWIERLRRVSRKETEH
jgi:DNA-directed RNA polymerase specialized sigma24 family protein